MTYILYNPFSGNHSAEEEAKVVSALQNDETVVQDITAIKDYRSFFAQLTEYDTVILCGGDGTLNRFVNDTANIDIRCNLLRGKGCFPPNIPNHVQNHCQFQWDSITDYT